MFSQLKFQLSAKITYRSYNLAIKQWLRLPLPDIGLVFHLFMPKITFPRFLDNSDQFLFKRQP